MPGSGITNSVLNALAAECAVISGVSTASSVPTDGVPGTPFMYLGPPRLIQVPGTWETRTYTITLHYLLARTSTEQSVQIEANDALDTVLNAFRTGVNLSGQGLPADASVIVEIVGADTDKFYTFGQETYQSVDFDLRVQLFGGVTYNP